MGKGTAVVTPAVRDRLASEPLSDWIAIERDEDWGDGLRFLRLASVLLPFGECGAQEVVLTPGGGVRFKNYNDA